MGTEHGEPTEVEEFRSTVLARQTEAEEAFVTDGDPGPRMDLWSKNDPVTLFGAIGMSQSGWGRLSETFTWVASRFSDVSDFHFDVEVVGVDGDLAYTLGFERFNGSIAGRPVEPVLVRVTHIYRREDGAWKIVHRHADNPGPDTRMERMSGDARSIHAARGEGDSLRNPVATAGPLEIKARGEETGGALTACESVTMPGEGPPLHKHAIEDEVMYFVDGAFRLRIDDEVMDMAPGSFAFVPRDTPHSWQNVSEGQAHMLFVFTPASPGMERFFERFAEVAGEGSAVREAFAELAEDAGMTVLGPPLAQSHPLP